MDILYFVFKNIKEDNLFYLHNLKKKNKHWKPNSQQVNSKREQTDKA